MEGRFGLRPARPVSPITRTKRKAKNKERHTLIHSRPSQRWLTPLAHDSSGTVAQFYFGADSEEAHPERQWSYDLLPGCVLRIDVDGAAGPRPAIDIPLLGASVKVATNKTDETFDVEVKPARPASEGETTVLAAQEWAQAIGMARILRMVEKGCTDA